ncbi:lipopolysaccharide transport periplasmic protein LptA [Oxalobacteraceae bacterium OM1]|nr:lipopolysaccharide transport periplasmic protein LptA [Oxalobacteraceae bacterium OM1]
MKRFLSVSLLAACAMGAGGVRAERADLDKPTTINADRMAYDDVKQVNTFTGNVVLTRGTLVMKANKLVVTQDPAGYQYATLLGGPNGVATFRQKREGPGDQWIEGQAERIEYDGKAELVKLYSKARMKRLEGNKPTDEVEGEFISYDSRKEFFSVNNTATGESKPGGGRVTAVIQPRSDASKGKQ